MDLSEAVKARHSVREYKDEKIEGSILAQLEDEIEQCNLEGDLQIQLITEDPDTFKGFLAHYGKFRNVSNYIAIVGEKNNSLNERAGYYGERLVLKAQQLGLNTCWVALTFRKGKQKAHIREGEKLVCVISVGYGKTQGKSRKSKSFEQVTDPKQEAPEWFRKGIEFALLAPTAVNQQKFLFSLNGNNVSAKATGGFCSDIDLGIVKYHFELGAGKENFHWEEV
ncbi:nitroreductase family protein [Filifactor villosus]|uniref:Nitroreductase family protein n=1 Tax=Filifactor villosus TaxID=29374 RepID=A0ABV9QK49_9FIRM